MTFVIGAVSLSISNVSPSFFLPDLLFICIAFWGTSLVPGLLGLLLGFICFCDGNAARSNTSNILQDSSRRHFGLLFSGMVFGAAINHTGDKFTRTRLLDADFPATVTRARYIQKLLCLDGLLAF